MYIIYKSYMFRSVCIRQVDRDIICVHVYNTYARTIKHITVCVCVCEREREREREIVCGFR